MAGGITDTDFAAGPRDKVEAIENVPWSDLEAAARDIVRAATEARQKEFVQDTMSSGYDPETGEPRINYQDYSTGEFWIQQGTSEWMNSTTGEVINHDPRSVDPTQYQWVVEAYVYFYERWPSYPLVMGQECEQAKSAIQEEGGQMAALTTAANIAWNGWGGDAQRNFTQFFMDPFENAVTSQQTVLDELAVGMYAYAAMLKQARVAAKTTATEVINVLDSLGDSNPAEAALAIQIGIAVAGVVAAVAAFAAAPVTGGTSVVLGAGLLLAGLDGAAAVVQGVQLSEQEKPPLSGGTVDEVMGKLRTALETIKHDMDTIEQNIANLMSQSSDKVNEWLTSTDPQERATILPNEPDEDGVTDVTGGEIPGPDEFRPRT
jgi:hypothetical protein